jgi:hypothetical protein
MEPTASVAATPRSPTRANVGGYPVPRKARRRRAILLVAATAGWLSAGAADVASPRPPPTAHERSLFQIDTWETEHGLPENSATAMVQSLDGYLWFGTFNGLVRFDGLQFTVYDRQNTPELPSPAIVELHLDQRGRLWVCTLARDRRPRGRSAGAWIHRADPARTRSTS